MAILPPLLQPKASFIYFLECFIHLSDVCLLFISTPRLWAIFASHACRCHSREAQAGQDGGMTHVTSPFFLSCYVDWCTLCLKCTNCASACKRCDEARPCLRCQKYGLTDSCVDGVRKARKVGVKRGPYKRKSKASAAEAAPYPGQLRPARTLCHISYFPLGFPPSGEGSWVAPSDQAGSALPGATPAIAAQYMPEGYWPYPYYPPPPGYVPPPPDGHTNGDGAPHGQPPHHPAYYPIHPGYPPMPIYPPPPGAYGPIPTLPGQAQATEQAVTSDDDRAVVERPKKKRRVGGEEGAKSSKKSKRGTNSTSVAVVVTAPAPASDDSPDDHGSPVAHNGSGGEPLPPVIAAA